MSRKLRKFLLLLYASTENETFYSRRHSGSTFTDRKNGIGESRLASLTVIPVNQKGKLFRRSAADASLWLAAAATPLHEVRDERIASMLRHGFYPFNARSASTDDGNAKTEK